MGANLFTALFYLLLFLLVKCGTLCTHVCATPDEKLSSGAKKEYELFKEKKESIKFESTGDKAAAGEEVVVDDYYLPALLSAGDVLVGLAGVNRTKASEENIIILAKYVESDKLFKGEVDPVTEGGLKSQFVFKYKVTKNEGNIIKGLLAVTKESKIYLFLVNYTNKAVSSSISHEWTFNFIVGDATNEITEDKLIDWKKEKDPLVVSKVDQFNDILKKDTLTVQLLDGSAFVIGENKKIVFILKIKTTKNKNIFGLIDFDETSNNKLNLSYVESTGECDPQFFPWGEKIIMVSTHSDPSNGNQKVKEFIYKEKNWVKDDGKPTFFTADYLKEKNNFTTITVENTEVLLFTKETEEKKGLGENTFTINLWMTDGSRVRDLGTIISGLKGTFYGFTLHKTSELLALFQIYEVGGTVQQNGKIYFTRLTEKLEKIKETVRAWKNVNGDIQKLCGNKSTTVTPCFTDRLVGFLSAHDNKEWKDKYLTMDAKIIEKDKATKVDNGFSFIGENIGAKWPEDKPIESYPYDFTNLGFTLVATVKIEENNGQSHNSLLGVGISGDGKRFGLWCSKENEWAVGNGDESSLKKSKQSCVKGKTYSVALILNNDGKIIVHIDWKEVKSLEGNALSKPVTEKITHFYFGADVGTQEPQSTAKSHVSVTNVLLYNRPFEEREIAELRKDVKPTEATKNHDTGNKDINAEISGGNTAGGSSNEQTLTPSPESTGDEKENDEKVPSPSRTEDGGVGGGVRVFSLLLAVLCVSAPLLHL